MNEKQYVGILYRQGSGGIVELDRPDDFYGAKVSVSEKDLGGAPFGMKVVIEIDSDASQNGSAKGKVVETLGDPSNPDVAITAIIRSLNLRTDFPAEASAEALTFATNLCETEVLQAIKTGRVDLRDANTITIDGLDAKDLDDAIEVNYDAHTDCYTLRVSIADVGEVVKAGSALDEEAFLRSNSVYLVDRVIPMLPPRLSNGLCSLNPNADRFALTAEMIIDAQGQTIEANIYESVIRSKVRSSYEEVKCLLDGGDYGVERPSWFLPTLKRMKSLYDILLAKRKWRGAIDFTIVEPHIVLDESGVPITIEPYPSSYANGIIEEFMIAANVAVAKLALAKRLPIIYRSHGEPDFKRFLDFSRLIKNMGVATRLSSSHKPYEVAEAMDMVGKRCNPSEVQTISKLLLRSMAKAEYSAINSGHYGLALNAYCHFTSPIRRYADLRTHRVLKAWLKDETQKETHSAIKVAELCSINERVAMRAERDTMDQKACEYFASRIGEEYVGHVSGFCAHCCFVEILGSVDGALMFRDLPQYYSYDPQKLKAVPARGGKTLGIGDEINIGIAKVDLLKRKIDLYLAKPLGVANSSEVKGKANLRKKKSTVISAKKRLGQKPSRRRARLERESR